MSDIAPIGSAGTPPSPSQGVAGGGSGQAASSSSSAGATAIQETHQSMSMSVSSQVSMLAAQIGIGGESDQTTRDLVVTILLMMLLELLEGRQSEDQLKLGALSGGQSGTLLLTSGGMSTSMTMSSSSYQMTAVEAYSSNAAAADGGAGAAQPITPTDTDGATNAGDGGHQLNVVA